VVAKRAAGGLSLQANSAQVAQAFTGVLTGLEKMVVTTNPGKKQIQVKGESEVKQEVVREAYVVRADVVLAVDISGSMSGTESEEVFLAIGELFKVLNPDDRTAITLFGDSTRTVLELTKLKRLRGGFPACLPPDCWEKSSKGRASFKCSGRTRLWDTVGDSLEVLARREISDKAPSHPHLVVLTDGMDTCSTRHNQSSIREILMHPGKFAKETLRMPTGGAFDSFHATCISVGSEAATNFATMGKSNLHHAHADDARGIRACFQEVKKHIERIRVTKREVVAKVKETVSYLPVGGASSGGSGKKGGSGGGGTFSTLGECKFFRSPGGCSKGSACPYGHPRR
jgi:hypothetical protein